jgi:hypothetical protein
VVPYSLDTNDMRFVQAQGFNTGDHFFTYLRDAFDALYAEGDAGDARMMSIGMHCRLLGKPGRIGSLQRFLDHIQSRERVWICRRIDIARHWKAVHPSTPPPPSPGLGVIHEGTMLTLQQINAADQAEFTALLDGTYEHSPWVAEAAWAAPARALPRWPR